MSMMRTIVPAQINNLGPDEVRVVMSTSALARDGHILVPQGCVLDNYRANPIVLWGHDPDLPIGNAEETAVSSAQLSAKVRFAPVGISLKADEVRGLTKAGVIRAVSVGFDPLEMEPLDPKQPRGGQRINRWELLELSFVSVPADPGARVTARSQRAGKVLSGANASALQTAHDLAEGCRSAIAGVLAGAGEGDAGDTERARRQREARQLEVARLGACAPTLSTTEAARARRQRDIEVLSLGPGAVRR